MATKTTKPATTLRQVEREYATDAACKALLKDVRWPDGKVHCPRCGLSLKVYKTSDPYRWKCKHCSKHGYKFSVLTGTVFENTNVPLATWFRVAFLMVSSKKGISALQVHRMIDPVHGSKGAYRTAWYMCHRLRAAMKDGGMFNPPKLTGEVEVDETYIGGKNWNRHGGGRGMLKRTGKRTISRDDKVPVVGAIARKGNVICQVIERVNEHTLTRFVEETVSTNVSLVATDEHKGYGPLSDNGYPHETVNHTSGEYVRGNVHTANLDNFWSMLKRGIVGTFHQVSKEHLPLYLNEFSWRYNHRHDPEIFRSILAGC
jgi:transposase-like protein